MKEIHNMIEMEDAGCDNKLKALFEHVQQGERNVIQMLVEVKKRKKNDKRSNFFGSQLR